MPVTVRSSDTNFIVRACRELLSFKLLDSAASDAAPLEEYYVGTVNSYDDIITIITFYPAEKGRYY